MAFTRPVDIGNRACQHLGAQRILTTDFSEVSQQAQEIGACYDNLRDAELRRNTWNFAIRRNILRAIDLATVVWTPPAYAAGTTYSVGAIVVDTAGVWWQSLQGSNTGNTPAYGSAFWTNYFGPDCGDPYDYTGQTAYNAGELVVVPAAWAGGTTYAINSIVSYTDGNYYVSLTNSNVGNTPSTSTANWMLYQSWTQQVTIPPAAPLVWPVYVGTPTVYLALVTGATGTTPVSVQGWLALNGTVANLQILFPFGAGPRADTRSLNAYRLPHGFLRRAPSNPKGQASPWLGAPHGSGRSDWLLENGYIVTGDTGPLMIRWVCDFQDVSRMDPMFCEGLAARIALEVCDRITGSNVDRQEATASYKKVMGEARLVNSVEDGAVDPPLDPYITCRI